MTKKRKANRRASGKLATFMRIMGVVKAILMIPAASISLAVLFAFVWFYYSGGYSSTKKQMHAIGDKVSVASGLTLEDVLLEGQKYTPQDEILQVISKSGVAEGTLNVGEPLLNIRLRKIKGGLEQLTWVKDAEVERRLPSTLSVRITERTPVALWQNDGKVNLIDEEGEIISNTRLENFNNLIIMVGKDAPSYMSYIMELIKSEPELYPRVSSVIRVSDRRWNIRLRNNIEIKLPENDPEKAWKYLAKVEKESNILDGDVKNIDLRIEQKMFVK